MEVLILILVLVALILVHEFGHFVVAKLAGMRVDEFGIGYPPKALSLGVRGDTEYTLNWLPFGGFVRIYGEDSEARDADAHPSAGRAFTDKPRAVQVLVLVAGIAMNMLFAFLLFTFILLVGTPRALSPAEATLAHDARLAVATVLPASPAASAGLAAGDIIESASYAGKTYAEATPDSFTVFVSSDTAQAPIAISVLRNGAVKDVTLVPEPGVIVSDPARPAIGLGVATIGTVPLSFPAAVTEGAQTTWYVTKATSLGLYEFFAGIVTGHADFSQISGPVGIAGAVGTASAQGFTDLLSLVAVISVNLALINVIPVPALDGGRLLFVLIEAVIRRPLHPGITRAVNTLGFALLVLLMLAVTAHDIFKIFV
ncbi:M50 family metallopeptidase [Patescibacteria group bacterium]|nr:M50 family metallopeptidase [Patescibacteria group bacterium]